MTESTTTQAQAAINSEATVYDARAASRRLGLAMVAQADLLMTMNLVTPTGMTAAVTQELAVHMRSVGEFLARGNGTAVIFDRQTALAAAVSSFLMNGAALDLLNVDVSKAMNKVDAEPLAEAIEGAVADMDQGDASTAMAIVEITAPMFAAFIGEAPVEPLG